MNPHHCRVTLRPRDPFEVLDLTLRFLRSEWRAYAPFAAFTVAVPWAAASVLAWFAGGAWWVAALPVVFALPVQALFTVLTGKLLFSQRVSSHEVLLETVRRAPGWAGLVALRWSGVAVASLLSCGAASLFALAGGLFASEVALLEQAGGKKGARRLGRLARAHFGWMLLGTLLMVMVAGWSVLVAEWSVQWLVADLLQLGAPFGRAWDGRVTPGVLLGLFGVQPVLAVFRLFLYVDCRTRGEGWDLQVGLRAAGLPR